jgi:hypothetical protein
MPNALVQLQAHYHHCGVAASEKCLSAATSVRWLRDLFSLDSSGPYIAPFSGCDLNHYFT